MLVGHSLLSPLLFILAFELYISSGSRNFVYGHVSSVTSGLLLAVGLCSGLNFGLPPFLNFWVEVSLFSLQGSIWIFSLIPLMLTSFLCYLFSVLFYVLACGGPSSMSLQQASSLYLFLPSVFLSFILSSGRSIFLF